MPGCPETPTRRCYRNLPLYPSLAGVAARQWALYHLRGGPPEYRRYRRTATERSLGGTDEQENGRQDQGRQRRHPRPARAGGIIVTRRRSRSRDPAEEREEAKIP